MPVKRTTHVDMSRLTKLAKDLEQNEVASGWLETARYEDGKPVAYIAAIQEFGHAPHIPPRPFMRPTVEAQSLEWAKIYGHAIKTAASGTAVLEIMGGKIAGDMREAISELTSPGLAESTIKARQRKGNGSTKPLVDTRVMINTLTHIVRGKTG